MTRQLQQKKMPVVFIGHGSPMNAIDDNEYTQALKNLGKSLMKPEAILVVSAHWTTRGTGITAMENPKTIHDFYGFPKPLFDIQYPAKGDPELAQKISEQFRDTEIRLDMDWGLDHGTWAVLRHIYPDANIPVLQLSLDMSAKLKFHFEFGKKLSALREQGILIIGSGNIVHNLREIDWNPKAAPKDWAVDFDNWVNEKLVSRDYKSLFTDVIHHPQAEISHPSIEHYLPLLYIIGASEEADNLKTIFSGIQNASISMRSFMLESKSA